MKDIKTRINKLIDGKSEETVKQIFGECLESYNKPQPTFMYSIDGQEGEEFEAEDYESAVYKVASWSGVSVWEVN